MPDYIAESLLEPSKKIKEGYHTTVVSTKDGKVLTGAMVRESKEEVVLRDPAGNEIAIDRKTIAKRQMTPISMMPPGLIQSLSEQEAGDLVRFLSSLGKGEYQVPDKGFVRRWLIPVAPLAAGADPMKAMMMPIYSRVNGSLLPADLASLPQGVPKTIYFDVEVSTAGEIGLQLDNTKGVQLLANGAKLPIAKDVRVKLPKGRSRLGLSLDPARKAPLSVEIIEVSGSKGRARPPS